MFKAMMRWEWRRMMQPGTLGLMISWVYLGAVKHLFSDDGMAPVAIMFGFILIDGMRNYSQKQLSDFVYFYSRPLNENMILGCRVISSSIAIIVIWILSVLIGTLWSMSRGIPMQIHLASNSFFFMCAFLGISYNTLRLANSPEVKWVMWIGLIPSFIFIMAWILSVKVLGMPPMLSVWIFGLVVINIATGILLARFSRINREASPWDVFFGFLFPGIIGILLAWIR